MNYFIATVIVLFVCGSVVELCMRNYAKALFYLLSGVINIVAMFLR